MSKNNLQCKYLEAGAKSSPVVLDTSLSTSNDQTLYLYHSQRDQIIEYRRDIVEAKLRELTDEEAQQVGALQQAYQQARTSFTPRGSSAAIPESAPAPKTKSAPEMDEVADDDDIDLIDDDALVDDKEE